MLEKHEVKIIGGRKEDFEGCESCKYVVLPEEACQISGCIHVWDSMRDLYERDEKITR